MTTPQTNTSAAAIFIGHIVAHGRRRDVWHICPPDQTAESAAAEIEVLRRLIAHAGGTVAAPGEEPPVVSQRKGGRL